MFYLLQGLIIRGVAFFLFFIGSYPLFAGNIGGVRCCFDFYSPKIKKVPFFLFSFPQPGASLSPPLPPNQRLHKPADLSRVIGLSA